MKGVELLMAEERRKVEGTFRGEEEEGDSCEMQ